MPVTETDTVPDRFRAAIGFYDASVPPALLVVPTVASIDPATAEVGSADVTLHVHGTGFSEYSVIVFNGGAEATTFVDETELTTLVEPSTASGPWTVPVQVRNGVQTSEPVDFEFTEAAPAPPAPTGVTAGTPGAFTPAGAAVPATIGDLRALGIGSGEAWTEGQYVVIGSGNVHWDGADWVMGAAPAPEVAP